MAVSNIQPIPTGSITRIPTNLINSKITVLRSDLRKYGRFAEIVLEGTANANIASWENLLTSLPLEYKPYETNNAYTINVDENVYVCNMNHDGIVNTVAQINNGKYIKFHAVYFINVYS